MNIDNNCMKKTAQVAVVFQVTYAGGIKINLILLKTLHSNYMKCIHSKISRILSELYSLEKLLIIKCYLKIILLNNYIY